MRIWIACGEDNIVRKGRVGGLWNCSGSPEPLSVTAVGAKISWGGVHVKVLF